MTYMRMGERCKVCKGNRGQIVARVQVIRKSPYGEWKYIRYTHRVRLSNGAFKRKYCYDVIESE